ncbi:MAG: hypothetical protein ACLQVY_10915 [Limisphaerales bacterium]
MERVCQSFPDPALLSSKAAQERRAPTEILFFAPKFFGYDVEIAEALTARGAVVHCHSYLPSSSNLVKAIVRVRRGLVAHYTNGYFKDIISRLHGRAISHILIIKGETITKHILQMLQSAFPCARIIFYMWDSIKNYPNLEENIGLVDKALSFDPDDSVANRNVTFRPLFFSRSFASAPGFSQGGVEYDVSFVGTIHSDRLRILNELEEQFRRLKLTFRKVYFLRSSLQYYWGKLVDPAYRSHQVSDFVTRPIPSSDVRGIFFKSRVIIDIQHPGQQGLTMRTVEALGSRRKLITTNATIRTYDFYSPENIHVIKRHGDALPPEFFKTAGVDVPECVYHKYTIEGWLDDIFS